MSAELAVQKALRARFVATSEVTALVPATGLLDSNQRPAPSPSILLGESQAIDEGNSIKRNRQRVVHTLHVWKREASLEGVKTICGAVRSAVAGGRLDLGVGFHCADVRVSSMRQMRDPDGEWSHGIVTVDVLVVEVAA